MCDMTSFRTWAGVIHECFQAELNSSRDLRSLVCLTGMPAVMCDWWSQLGLRSRLRLALGLECVPRVSAVHYVRDAWLHFEDSLCRYSTPRAGVLACVSLSRERATTWMDGYAHGLMI